MTSAEALGDASKRPPESQQKTASDPSPSSDQEFAKTALEFAKQSEKLSLQKAEDEPDGHPPDVAVHAKFVTPQDPVIVTAAGNRLPAVPLSEAHKLNILKEELSSGGETPPLLTEKQAFHQAEKIEAGGASEDTDLDPALSSHELLKRQKKKKKKIPFASVQSSAEGTLERTMPPSHTNPLFPPLPLYGPPSLLRNLQSATFRFISFFLSLSFLSVIVLGSLFTSIPGAFRRVAYYATFRDPDAGRPLYAEEKRRAQLRRDMARSWKRRQLSEERIQYQQKHKEKQNQHYEEDNVEDPAGAGIGNYTYKPTEGGPDPLVPDVGYYARRVGLDVETFEVQTEDGFIIDLWHVYDPREYTPRPPEARRNNGPELLFEETTAEEREAIQEEMLQEAAKDKTKKKPKFPVLLVHGLLQSAGAYCVNDDDSLAFYLCKSGYDVWLGNNRCGFKPKHAVLKPSDPRMWCWNIRQMGVFDLPALASRVLRETRFARLGLVAHSQGTTETLVALAKEQRPELGKALTVFCALAPAAYAGRLIGKMYFKFMRVITPAMFRLLFGIHAFIPLMMQVHPLLPGTVYGWFGYRVFSFLFEWSDVRWDRGLRDRMFQFAPVYVSAESMRWWLGRDGFARHKCILSTKEAEREQEREQALLEEEEQQQEHYREQYHEESESEQEQQEQQEQQGKQKQRGKGDEHSEHRSLRDHHRPRIPRHHPPGATAWYDDQAPPFALWVCGHDDLVDGRRLLKRFLPAPAFAALLDPEKGADHKRVASSGRLRSAREPHVRVVHAKFLPEYEHLDVIWAMDAVDQVFAEVREVLWKTCTARDGCRVPTGCEDVAEWVDPGGPGGKVEKDQEGGSDEQEGISSSSSGTDAA